MKDISPSPYIDRLEPLLELLDHMSAAGIRDQHVTLPAANPEEDSAGRACIPAQLFEHCMLGGSVVIDPKNQLSLTAVKDVKSCSFVRMLSAHGCCIKRSCSSVMRTSGPMIVKYSTLSTMSSSVLT